jgi:hypothetical protein
MLDTYFSVARHTRAWLDAVTTENSIAARAQIEGRVIIDFQVAFIAIIAQRL